jgi:hypothetical protein
MSIRHNISYRTKIGCSQYDYKTCTSMLRIGSIFYDAFHDRRLHIAADKDLHFISYVRPE